MTETAAAQGVELHLLDHRRPIVEQGLFDGIIHKLRPNKGGTTRDNDMQHQISCMFVNCSSYSLLYFFHAEWEANLTDYAKQHPEVIIIDHLERIKTLQNRSTMLFPVQGDGIVVQVSQFAFLVLLLPFLILPPCAGSRTAHPCSSQSCMCNHSSQPYALLPGKAECPETGPDAHYCLVVLLWFYTLQPAIGKIDAQDRGECVRIRAPEQVEILEGTSADAARHMVEEAGLTTPLLIKPLWSDGREGSHGLAVLHDIEALGKVVEGRVSPDLKPPLVVQQFVDHGGVLFKVSKFTYRHMPQHSFRMPRCSRDKAHCCLNAGVQGCAWMPDLHVP